jgi:hypothetical protein
VPHPPRPPAVSHGTAAFLWALGLGLFIFFGMLSISISKATSIVVAVLSGAVIYIAVRVLGSDVGPPQQRKPTHEREP